MFDSSSNEEKKRYKERSQLLSHGSKPTLRQIQLRRREETRKPEKDRTIHGEVRPRREGHTGAPTIAYGRRRNRGRRKERMIGKGRKREIERALSSVYWPAVLSPLPSTNFSSGPLRCSYLSSPPPHHYHYYRCCHRRYCTTPLHFHYHYTTIPLLHHHHHTILPSH